MLACIRCGACLNVCPVYRRIAGHAYDSVYTGPMGKVLTPLLTRGSTGRDLPGASTLCGACTEACPVEIPLADLLVRLRADLRSPGSPVAAALRSFGAARRTWRRRRRPGDSRLPGEGFTTAATGPARSRTGPLRRDARAGAVASTLVPAVGVARRLPGLDAAAGGVDGARGPEPVGSRAHPAVTGWTANRDLPRRRRAPSATAGRRAPTGPRVVTRRGDPDMVDDRSGGADRRRHGDVVGERVPVHGPLAPPAALALVTSLVAGHGVRTGSGGRRPPPTR